MTCPIIISNRTYLSMNNVVEHIRFRVGSHKLAIQLWAFIPTGRCGSDSSVLSQVEVRWRKNFSMDEVDGINN